MNKDSYGEVINGPETYTQIAIRLKVDKRVLIGWTDQEGGHYDILFVNGSPVEGTNIQGGVRGNDLFVSVMRVGAFGFKKENGKIYPDYINEKLGILGSFELTTLINEVKDLVK